MARAACCGDNGATPLRRSTDRVQAWPVSGTAHRGGEGVSQTRPERQAFR